MRSLVNPISQLVSLYQNSLPPMVSALPTLMVCGISRYFVVPDGGLVNFGFGEGGGELVIFGAAKKSRSGSAAPGPVVMAPQQVA
jgi:hypothetical protein